MRLAAALVMFTAGATAAVLHHDDPAGIEAAHTPRADAVDLLPRPNQTRASRYHHRRAMRRHHRTVWPPAAHDWAAVAACESGGNWSINTGNGFYGGLQFTLSTWQAFGGVGLPNEASEPEQVAVAERVLAVQGVGAWPVCGAHLEATP